MSLSSKTDLTRFAQDEAPAVSLHFLPHPLLLLLFSTHLSFFSYFLPKSSHPHCERSKATGCWLKLDGWGGVCGKSRSQRQHLLASRQGGEQVQLVVHGRQVEGASRLLLLSPPSLRLPLLHRSLFLPAPSRTQLFPLSVCHRSAIDKMDAVMKHHCLLYIFSTDPSPHGLAAGSKYFTAFQVLVNKIYSLWVFSTGLFQERQRLVLPCRPAAPGINVTYTKSPPPPVGSQVDANKWTTLLILFFQEELQLSFHPHLGFVTQSASLHHNGIYVCTFEGQGRSEVQMVHIGVTRKLSLSFHFICDSLSGRDMVICMSQITKITIDLIFSLCDWRKPTF